MKEDAKRREQNNPMKTCVLKYDHFENIHRLDAKLPVQEGAPNWRQVPGYLVFGTGQPTKTGFSNALRFIMSECGASSVLWTNMRQVSPSNIHLPSHQLCFYAGAGGVFKWAILHPSSARQVSHVSIFARVQVGCKDEREHGVPGREWRGHRVAPGQLRQGHQGENREVLGCMIMFTLFEG